MMLLLGVALHHPELSLAGFAIALTFELHLRLHAAVERIRKRLMRKLGAPSDDERR